VPLSRAWSQVHKARKQRLPNLADKLGVDPEIGLVGFVENPYAFMSRCLFFALTSAWEGLPGLLAGGLAWGCAVISTDSRVVEPGLRM